MAFETVDYILWGAVFILIYISIFWILILIEGRVIFKEKELKKFPLVSIVIPAYNEEKGIEDTISSALNLDYPKDKLQIIVVNDGSVDKTKEIVEDIIKKNKQFNITLINQKNKGKGTALNNGLKHAKGEFFVCFDADSTIQRDALKKLLPKFTDEKVAAVLPFMEVYKPKNLLEKIQWCEYVVNFFYKNLMSKIHSVTVTPGPFSVYRKSIFKKIGKFDENNITEDLEICLRIQKYHYRIIQLLNPRVFTKVPPHLKSFYNQRIRWYKGSLINLYKYRDMMFNKKYGDLGVLQVPRLLLGLVLALIFLYIFGYQNIFKPVVKRLYELSFINFDILYTIKNRLLNFQLLDINVFNIFIIILSFIVGFYIIYRAYKDTKEKMTKFGLFTILFYLFSYSLLSGIAWLIVVAELLMGKTKKW